MTPTVTPKMARKSAGTLGPVHTEPLSILR